MSRSPEKAKSRGLSTSASLSPKASTSVPAVPDLMELIAETGSISAAGKRMA